MNESTGEPAGEKKSEKRAGEREQARFDDQLTDEPPAGCAKRKTNADFFLTCGGASGEKSGDVGAGDEEHESDHAHEGEEMRAGSEREDGATAGAVAKDDGRSTNCFFLLSAQTGIEGQFVLRSA